MDAESLLALVAEIDAAKAADRRAKAAERQRRHREYVTQNSVTCVTEAGEQCHAKSRDMRDMRDGPAPPCSPPSPSPTPPPPTPPIIPPTPAGLGRAPESLSDLRQAIVTEFQRAGSVTIPDTSRAAIWLAKGYGPAICIATVSELLARNPNARSLAYFDQAIADAHSPPAARAPPSGRSASRPLTIIDGLIAHDARQAARSDL